MKVENLILLGDILRDTRVVRGRGQAWRYALTIIEELRLPVVTR